MPVLDASVYVASLSPSEVHHARARVLLEAATTRGAFSVPSVFRVEVVSALVRRGESAAMLRAVEVALASPILRILPVDDALVGQAMTITRRTGLRAYDALYAALAVANAMPLVTFDRDVQRRLRRGYPKLATIGV